MALFKLSSFGCLLIILLLSTSKSLAEVTCYACGGTACQDPFSADAAHRGTCENSCAKIKLGDAVTRGCSTELQSSGCIEYKAFGVEATTCYCNTYLCNESSHVTISLTTAVSACLITLINMQLRPNW